MTSVRQRLLVGTAITTTVICVLATLSLYFLARHFLIREVDSALRSKARAVAAMVDLADAGTGLEADDAVNDTDFQRGADPQYFEIVKDDGQLVAASPSLEKQRLDLGGGTGRPAVGARFLRLPDGRHGRAATVRAMAQIEDEHQLAPDAVPAFITITVAKSTAHLDGMLGRLRILLASVCGAATLALLALTAWVIRHALRPVQRLAREISSIGAHHLDERLDPGGAPRELVPVVSRLNDLLGRLQAAFEREKCFTSDAAHELRTPLAGLATALEVCAREQRDRQQYERVMHECLKTVRQMNGTIDNLLLLARADADQIPVTRRLVNVGDLLRETWARHQRAAETRKLQVDFQIDDDLVVETDSEKLAIILNNLLENAVGYANEWGRVSLRATLEAETVRICVANTGSRVRPEDCGRVFDRFWRGDGSQRSDGRHSGLGLAVCRKLSEALGWSIGVQCEEGGWFLVHLQLAHHSPAGKQPKPTKRPKDDAAVGRLAPMNTTELD